jgi:transposase
VVRRIPALLDLLVHPGPVSVLGERWGLSPSWLSAWQKACRGRGMDSLLDRHRGRRPEKLTPRQKQRLGEGIKAGPLVRGLETACGNAVWSRVLIWRELGVLYHRQYVSRHWTRNADLPPWAA